MQMRFLRDKDADDFRRIRLEALRECPESFGASAEEVERESVESFASLLRRPLDQGFILGVFDSTLIAIGGLNRVTGDRKRHKAWLWGMYVSRDAQGQGIGKALLKHMIMDARLMDGVEQLHLALVTGNTAARSLYQSLGFKSYGVEPRSLKIGDRRFDEELMVLHLR